MNVEAELEAPAQLGEYIEGLTEAREAEGEVVLRWLLGAGAESVLLAVGNFLARVGVADLQGHAECDEWQSERGYLLGLRLKVAGMAVSPEWVEHKPARKRKVAVPQGARALARQLMAAVRADKLDEVERLLSTGVDPYVKVGESCPMGLAVGEEHLEVLDRFFAHGVDPNRLMYDLVAPLHLAAMLDNVESARRLIAAGADVNRRDNEEPFHKTPLMRTVPRRCSEVMEALLQAGADPNLRTRGYGSTALHNAVGTHGRSTQGLALVRRLLEYGASPNVADDEGYTPLHTAIGRSGPAAVALLLEFGADVNLVVNEGLSPLELLERFSFMVPEEQAEVRAMLQQAGAK